MYECEDTSAGFHDLFLNKYADSSGSIMDFFISDSMQDMLDIDIRAEVATVVGSVSEFTSLVNDLPSSIEHDSTNSNEHVIEPDRWLAGETKWSGANEIYADVGACVNPNSVMPLINSSLLNSPRSQINLNTNNFQLSNSPLPSPKESKSHLTFSPNQIKIRPIEETKRHSSNVMAISQQPKFGTSADAVKKDLLAEMREEKLKKVVSATTSTPVIPATIAGGNTIKLAPGLGGLTFANGMAYTKIKHANIDSAKFVRTNHVNIVTHIKKEAESGSQSQQNQHVSSNVVNGNIYTSSSVSSPKQMARNAIISSTRTSSVISNESNSLANQSINNTNNVAKTKTKTSYHEFPKPPYSYSCLIAMALKNSRSGSLPVSEIYSFMCEHFPYFKTAPNGWKNSVRHNLSLNKCFEKIEKPATNGGQRKGCLWAMNPSKISKMDEEVQKWSRKDPMAIRQAMVCPEHLESLERGEMKHGSTGDSDGENDVQSDVEESSDLEGELDEQIIETPESIDDDDEEKYDIEVSNIYETIDISGGQSNKDSIQMAIGKGEVYEISDSDSPLAKKARLDINYSIAPASVFEHHSMQHQQPSSQSQQQHHNRRKMQLVNRIV